MLSEALVDSTDRPNLGIAPPRLTSSVMNKLSNNGRHEASRRHEFQATSNRRLDTPYTHSYLLPLSLDLSRLLSIFSGLLYSDLALTLLLWDSPLFWISGFLFKIQGTNHQIPNDSFVFYDLDNNFLDWILRICNSRLHLDSNNLGLWTRGL